MSIKIYGGKIFKTKNFYELNEQLKALAKKFEILKQEQVRKKAAEEIAYFVDMIVLHKTVTTEYKDISKIYDMFEIFRKKCESDNKSQFRVDSAWDLEASITIFPLKSGKILGIYNDQGSVKRYQTFLNKQPWIKDYHYQNSTDRPKNISAREWNKRKKDWNEVFKSIYYTSEGGATFQLASPRLSYNSFHGFEKYFPSIEQRKKEQIGTLAYRMFLETDEGKEALANSTVNNYFSTFEYPFIQWKEKNKKEINDKFDKEFLPLFIDLDKDIVKKTISELEELGKDPKTTNEK